MAGPSDINEPIIEALYCEALVLADEVRSVFDLSPVHTMGGEAEQLRIALSSEGLKTTTRMMHVLAWLLNHRAYFSGELSEFQLRKHGRLPPDRNGDSKNLALLEPATRELISETEALHARVARLDNAWRDRFEMLPVAVLGLHKRLQDKMTVASGESC